jgi:virulence-associated protein VapD
MDTFIFSLRYLAPLAHDRISDLLKKESCDPSFIIKAIPVLQMIHALAQFNPIGAIKKFTVFLTSVEKHVMTHNGFNMIIRNVPRVAEMRESKQAVEVKYAHIRDTLREFGYLVTFHMIRGTVYVKFAEKDTATRTHGLINNMQMGTNILKTEIIV